MLAGEPPFTGPTAQAIIARRLSEPVPRLRTLRDVSESVEEVVAKALARSPADRFVDTSQFAQALQAAVGAQPAVPTEPAPAAHRPAFRRRILLAAAGALIAVAVLLGLYRGLRRAPEVTLDRQPPRHRPLRRARSLAAVGARGWVNSSPAASTPPVRSAPCLRPSPCGGGRVARTQPPLRPSVAARERGWSCSAPWSRRGGTRSPSAPACWTP